MSIQKCTCKHDFQDQKYGQGMRVHTEDRKGNSHCTVCGVKPSWQRKLEACAKQWTPVCSMPAR